MWSSAPGSTPTGFGTVVHRSNQYEVGADRYWSEEAFCSTLVRVLPIDDGHLGRIGHRPAQS
jgi:hypothetical protein